MCACETSMRVLMLLKVLMLVISGEVDIWIMSCFSVVPSVRNTETRICKKTNDLVFAVSVAREMVV